MAGTANASAAAGVLTSPRRIGGTVVVLVLLGLAWATFGPAFLGGPMSMVIVSGDSMHPTMEDGDLAVVRAGADYAVGDVVAFHSDAGDDGGFVIHRIVGGSEAAGFVMQGDNNDWLDPWEPTSTEIVGELLWHVPDGGVWLSRIRGWLMTPLVMAAMVGAAAVMFVPTAQRRRRRRARTNRRREQAMATHPQTEHHMDTPRTARTPLRSTERALLATGVVGAVLVVASVPLAWSTWRAPATEATIVSGATGQAHLELSYTAVAKRASAVYPDGQVGPVTAPDPVETAVDPAMPEAVPAPDGVQTAPEVEPPQPLFTQMLDRVDVGVEYTLSSDVGTDDITGTYGADLEIRSAEGWATTVEALPETAFDGTSTAFEVPVVLDRVAGQLADYAAATGRSVDHYTVTVLPRVELTGTLAGEPLEEVLTAELPIEVDAEQVVPGGQLLETVDVDTSRRALAPATTDVLGASLSVSVARLVTATSLALGLLAAIASTTVLGRRRPNLRHRVLHGSLLVDVAPGTDDADRVLAVKDMRQLVRLAQREGRSILTHDLPGGAVRYFVPDGEVTYEYVEGDRSDGSEVASPMVVRLRTMDELTQRWVDPRSGAGAAIRREVNADGVVRCSLDAGDTLYVVDVPLTDLREDVPPESLVASGRRRLNGHGPASRRGH